MLKITELIEDFRLNQQVQERKDEYIVLCNYRLFRWCNFIAEEFSVEEVEPVHKKIHSSLSDTRKREDDYDKR